MRNINELIGIIKGINFDGIVNDKEVVRLQLWIDKNRNLVYEKKEAELITLVGAVIEDGIIDDNEREKMLAYCDMFLKGSIEDAAKIYELNGIIEGIICDGEVNESEVHHLKSWMDVNGTIVRGHKTSERVCKMVDDILEDGVVTAEEQEQLLRLLSVCINDSQLKAKIEYLKSQVKEKRNIGIDLIDLLDNVEALDEIHHQAQTQLQRALNSYTGSYIADQEIVFISLVLIAMMYYDGNYYENVRIVYKDLYRYHTEQKIEGLIRTILNRYRPKEDERKGKERIINVALSNAIVPGPFLKSFFEFIYDIYKLNFECNLPEDMTEEFQFVYDGLRESMLSEGDDIKINATKKTYKLIKSTKQLITNKKSVEDVIRLSKLVAKLIDKRIWNKEIKIFNPYLKTGFEGWVETIKEERTIARNASEVELRSRWEPQYVLTQNTVYIVPPIHRVKSYYDYRDLCVIVKNRDKIIYENNKPDIREIIGGYQLNISKIRLDAPLGECRYQVLAKDEIIYDSREKLYRKFLVFNNDGCEISNNTDYTGTAIFCTKNDGEIVGQKYHSTENFVLSSKNVLKGDAYLICGQVFNFSSFIKPGIFGEKRRNHSISIDGNINRLPVYSDVKCLMFEASSVDINLEIVIDGKKHKLSEVPVSIAERDGVKKYVVEMTAIDDGIHKIEVNAWKEGKRKRILVPYTFAVDKKLKTEMIKLDDYLYMVSIESGLLSNSICKEVDITALDEHLVPFTYGGQIYNYHIPFEFQIYRIDSREWIPSNVEIWSGDLRSESVIDIYGLDADEMRVYTSEGECVNTILNLKCNDVYQRISVGFLLSYKPLYEYMLLVFMKEGKRVQALYCYNKCVLKNDKTNIVYDSSTESLDVTPYFIGKGNVFCVIKDDKENEICKSSYLENGMVESIFGLQPFQKYVVEFYEKEKGLSLKKERFLGSYEQIFYTREGFVGRSFKIPEVQYDQFVRGEFLRKNHYFNKTYIYFAEQISEDVFVGEVYARTSKGTFMLDNINPVEIEICSDVIDDGIELSITKEGDGLLLDFEHHGIKNTIDDNDAVDIFSYTMQMNGVETF